MFRLVRANLPASNGAQQFRIISVWGAGVLMKGQGNMRIKTLPENLREDVREESLSEWVDPAVEEFSEHIVVRVELLQIGISEFVCWNVAPWWFPRSIPCFDSSEVSSSTRSLKKRIEACHNDDEQAVNIGDVFLIKWERVRLVGAVVSIMMLCCRLRSSSRMIASIEYNTSSSREGIGSLKNILHKSSPLILTKFGLS